MQCLQSTLHKFLDSASGCHHLYYRELAATFIIDKVRTALCEGKSSLTDQMTSTFCQSWQTFLVTNEQFENAVCIEIANQITNLGIKGQWNLMLLV